MSSINLSPSPPRPHPTPGLHVAFRGGEPSCARPLRGTLRKRVLTQQGRCPPPHAPAFAAHGKGDKPTCCPGQKMRVSSPSPGRGCLVIRQELQESVHQTPDGQTLNSPLCMTPSYSTSISDSLHWNRGNEDTVCLKLIGNTILSDEIMETFSLTQRERAGA